MATIFHKQELEATQLNYHAVGIKETKEVFLKRAYTICIHRELMFCKTET